MKFDITQKAYATIRSIKIHQCKLFFIEKSNNYTIILA